MATLLSSIDFWQHDLCSCLQATLATALIQHGHDPTLVLGAAWDFHWLPGEVGREEFYYPCRGPDLARSLAPYHPVTSRWHTPTDAESAWAEVKACIERGVPAIVAVDNFYLPFRPAYRDVHAAHLVVVYGFDEAAGQVYLLDSMPPAFNGPLAIEHLRAARASGNPDDGSDAFFSQAPIGGRWLEVDVCSGFPAISPQWVRHVLSANLERFGSSAPGPGLGGMAGLRLFLANLVERASSPDERIGRHALKDLYVLGWAIQARTALHADFLASVGERLGWLELVEAGRAVDRVAHHWTALRMTGAHALGNPRLAAPRLAVRARRLLSDQQRALDDIEHVLGDQVKQVKQ